MNIINWLLISLILIGAEVAFFTGSFLLWIGASSLVSSFLFWTIGVYSFLHQIIIFSILSFVSLIIGQKIFKSKDTKEISVSKVNLKIESLIGMEFKLTSPIINRRGRIQIGDVYWLVEGPDLSAGTIVKVLTINGNILCVIPKKS